MVEVLCVGQVRVQRDQALLRKERSACCRQREGRDDGANVRLEQVRAHARDVAHVVAHVVSDGSGVSRVVLRDSSLDLAHEVCSDVGGLGVDAAAHPREEGYR